MVGFRLIGDSLSDFQIFYNPRKVSRQCNGFGLESSHKCRPDLFRIYIVSMGNLNNSRLNVWKVVRVRGRERGTETEQV